VRIHQDGSLILGRLLILDADSLSLSALATEIGREASG
jgi:hypothetical protein